MRMLSPISKMFLAIAAAIGVVVSIGMPWYGPAGGNRAININDLTRTGELQGPATGFFQGVERWFTAGGDKGSAELGSFETILLGLAALAVLTALATLVPAIETSARSLLQMIAIGIGGIALFKLVGQPGDDRLIEPRRGGFLALGCGIVMLSAASGIAHARLRRAPAQTMSTLHDPKLTHPGSVAPPGV